MERKNILVLFGGGGSEHDISKTSSEFIIEHLNSLPEFNPILVEITRDGHWESDGRKCSLNGKILKTPTEQPYIDYVIPCIHGAPGESGEIQSFLETHKLPYFGCDTRSSVICFDKILTKLWLEKIGIKTAPWIFTNISAPSPLKEIESFFKNNGEDLFVKASEQGSSVGCYHVTENVKIPQYIEEAFSFGDNLLIEKTMKARELEVAIFEHQGKVIATVPGEIICPTTFYDFEQKYNQDSKTTTNIEAENISREIINEIKYLAIKAFKTIGLRHLSRIDFFLTDSNEIYINEINTFPGMTPISMFPLMMEHTGVMFKDYIRECINSGIEKRGRYEN